tara:strand:- start:48 stop:530 length:483 start_codon:yes stop_codon:yes gene_type:complete
MNFSQEDEDRFWSKVDIKSENECWNWTGYTSKGGYGQFYLNGSYRGGHRCSLVLAHAVQPLNKTWALHTCVKNKKCVNPNHLYYGTPKENSCDMIKDGTQAKGEINGQCKLTEVQVREIREKYIPRKYPAQKLAGEYGVSSGAIYTIINNKRWKHLNPKN